ncbi:camp-mediated signaling protein sok [Stemphylium lycopersici]|uniref:Camp-mediated signaling protein sok n=1 Tax=Stemphylium lycopersici TaxID=183478 RepID=A0A364N5S4_STELY|nr:camp-mediated signaling protein sok [Stemphylium lycopersici]RAR12616.1 camp-mediated signaling protein sok [Stemphylium lycopersici]
MPRRKRSRLPGLHICCILLSHDIVAYSFIITTARTHALEPDTAFNHHRTPGIRHLMRTRPSMQKNLGGVRRRKDMASHTPKAAAGTNPSYAPDSRYASRSGAMDVDGMDVSTPSWHSSISGSEGQVVEERHSTGHSARHSPVLRIGSSSSPSPRCHSATQEDLAGMLKVILSNQPDLQPSAEELAEEFLYATVTPPVTKQSLSELDIQSIITNIKLRHDINFDRDLSFRPNLDGAKGQEKERTADRYWTALIAELELYKRLFQGTPPIPQIKLERYTREAQRRIPTLFQTIRDVIKSLVPDCDHSRVDEHLDVDLLMQSIERGVCDFVRLAEWMAHLLKEHCAPMRDVWVDEMVAATRHGAATQDSKQIVFGLRTLFGILEAMKLDVANHQIRNLKTLLIEDTVNFENHYHLDRLVNGRSRVNISTTRNWFANTIEEFGSQCSPRPRAGPCFELDVFTRAITAISFRRDGCGEFPETFLLDNERLRALKTEIDDLVMFEVCMDMCIALARQFGYQGPITLAIGQQLRTALAAIMGDTIGHGPHQWMINSEALSLEILRQASNLAGQPATYSFDRMSDANQSLRVLFVRRSAHHAARLEASLLPQILVNVDRLRASSPMDLFNSLVSISPSMPPLPILPRSAISDTSAFAHLHPETAKLTDLANRITHMILLNWRIWAPIAYIQEEHELSRHSSTDGNHAPTSPVSQTQNQQPRHQPSSSTTKQASSDQEASSLPTSMRTGEKLDPGQEPHLTHRSLPQ